LGLQLQTAVMAVLVFTPKPWLREQELAEALGVAIIMGGGPSAMYAAETLSAYKEFSAK